MKSVKAVVVVLLYLSISSIIAGCASAPVVKNRVFWPPLPDDPKIEWLGAYRTENDLPKTGSQKFFKNIIGEEEQIRFNRAMGIASDGSGKVYITDPSEMQVVVYDFNKNKVHVFAEKDKELQSMMKEPMGIAVDNNANIYVSDASAKKVFVFNRDEKLINTINLTQDTKRPFGIAIDNDRKRLVVADPVVHNLEVYDLNGKHMKTIGKLGSGPGEFYGPTWVTVLRNGNIAVSESRNCRLQLLDPEGKSLQIMGQRGDRPGELQMPKGIAADSENHLYSVDGRANAINVFSETGEYLLTVGGGYSAERKIAPGGFLLPIGIFIDQKDTIYVVDQMNLRFQIFQYMNDKYKKENPVAAGSSSSVAK
ncbi:NHL repeat domain lipoprotein [Geotalea daltonii FRC-32]|uniref:NHL repeat domain lipoprotein n=1 Tax=Geotalea daltonii (strain DSM 22248 / JCM 15807 / FRC-32) TaxID=316067 RepID=B9M536_GEODF|nr:SMP-30/gluconolactonase/LRE family protein [Geotalea daltonii]ACM19791.1 NHL repeat domain lipoprotein [Geotalea daltonii FRC-32]